jgi:hypothetical protein
MMNHLSIAGENADLCAQLVIEGESLSRHCDRTR